MILAITSHCVSDCLLKSTSCPCAHLSNCEKEMKNMKSLFFIAALCVGFINSVPVHNGTILLGQFN